MTDRVGQQLGNYRLLRLLGRGGFAEVYLGEHVHLNSHAAVKTLHTQLSGVDAQQFVREAQTLARLSHPHIVRILDFAIQDGTPFLVMASALQYAHDQHLVHRDVKPENMVLGSRSEVLLSDFGLAMLAPHSSAGSTEAMER